MAVSVEFFSMLKKINSTKTPSRPGDVFMTESCLLKEPTDVIRPVLRLKIATSMGSPDFLNYAYIGEFTRYYWIRNWENVSNDIWICYLEEDFLASWKGTIGSATKYILRSSSAYNGDIVDSHYPARAIRNVRTTSISTGFDIRNATYVVGIIGRGTTTGSMGSVQYYAFNTTQLVNLFNTVFDSNATFLNISTADMALEVQKAFINPFQYIASAMLFPFDTTQLGTYVDVNTGINFGWWTLPCSGYKLNTVTTWYDITNIHAIPKHPQAATRGSYLNIEPYSHYMLYIPGCGYNNIDAGAMNDEAAIQIETEVDLITGLEKCHLYTWHLATDQTRNKEMIPIYGQAGVPIELAQIGRGGLELLGRSLTSIASTALQGFGGPIANTISGIVSAAGAGLQTVQSKGANGSTLDFKYADDIILENWYYTVSDQDLAELGAPLCENRQIQTLSGYVLCEDGQIDTNGLLEEKEAIARYLTSGFFYE